MVCDDSASARRSEVGDLHPAIAGDQDVAGLNVAVDEAALVCRGDRLRRLGDDPCRLARRQRRRSAG
jgi:hypothetical protein